MIVYSRYHGIGDALFVNTFAAQKGQESGQRIFVGTNHPSLFAHNPHVRILPFKTERRLNYYLDLNRWLGRKVDHVSLTYGNPGSKHIFDVLQEKTGVLSRPTRPAIFLSEAEKKTHLLSRSDGKKIVALQSTGLQEWTDNKNYDFDRYQQIVNSFARGYVSSRWDKSPILRS